MMNLCDGCKSIGSFIWVRDRVAQGGRRWEVYVCQDCGHEIEFAVA